MAGERLSPERAAELAANLAAVRARIAAACTTAGRDPAEVTLVAVGKTFPAADVAHLVGLGVTDVAESRDQEAAPKVADVAALLDGPAPRWHFVGQLQRNKAASVAAYADVVQSVDRAPLVAALANAAGRADRRIDVLIQVRLDDPGDPTAGPARGGAAPADVPALADAVAARAELRLRGLMAVAPRGVDPVPKFARLAELSANVRGAHPAADVVSAGMSGDLEAAVASGASWVRVGTALFGCRELVSDHVR